jgi:hypothetical protein
MANWLAYWDNVNGRLSALDRALIDALGLTAKRTYALPDASGTLALGDQTLMLTGFESWEGTGNYYSVTGSTLTLLRGATGRIDGIEVTCAANQTVTLTQYGCTYIGFDADGVLNAVADSNANEAWYRSNVVLFQGLYDGTASLIVVETHPAGTLQGDASVYAHHVFRSLIGLAPGEVNEIGGDITRVATGTGDVAGDRQIKIVGNAGLYDHGVMSMIPDSGGAAITSYFAYTDALGRWNAYAAQSEFPMVYNNAGTVTALPSGNYGINTVYVTKNEPNSGAITYITVIGTGNYANANTAETALANNQVTKATNELQRTEIALLGYVVIRNSGDGHIHTVKISKQVAGAAGLGGGVGGSAALTTTDTSGFNNVLSASDSTVQLALNTLDDHAHTEFETVILPNTTATENAGVIYKSTNRFIHDFNYGNNGTVTTIGQNTFVGVNAGNLTMGGAATVNTHSSYNSVLGVSALQSNTTGYSNSVLGVSALQSNTTGHSNSALGVNALSSNTTGYSNSAIGLSALRLNTTGYSNSALGVNAGRFLSNGTTGNATSNNSVFLGFDTRTSAEGVTNEIVIGATATGNGSNSATLGNDSVTKTVLKGAVGVGTTTPAASAQLDLTSTTRGFLPPRMTTAQRDAIASPDTGLMIFNTTTAKIDFYDGTAWRVVTST